ncbi:MAG: glucans biosynthesis glucosyltransferase MdoH [Alphaproteobacteria bacterium]|nr:glucans biosynthesis glucosyltransferase MdoH [Alphaproteobacteria bacterium]
MTVSDFGAAGAQHPAARQTHVMRRRRLIFLGLVAVTCVGLLGWMTRLLGSDGIDPLDVLMLALYAGTLPWVIIGLWNAVIGVGLINLRRDWLSEVLPLDGLEDDRSPVTAATAIVMPVYNEDPQRVFRHLRVVESSLASTGQGSHFEIFLLSDSTDPEIAAEEERRFAAWRAVSAAPDRIHYRRRVLNTRQKVGNIEDFCDSHGDRFENMIVLDADSLMSGEAILRLVRLMQRNPRLGILQTLAVGLPSSSAFARVFQFGMRHGMRAYTTGSAWWQGESGPYWGHNAILRMSAFRAHCRLPRLPGAAPLGGEILSHDQVEAALMRAAGYEVRVLPIEGGSYEENPPSLLDFIKRDLRWCQGNLQYFKLIGWPIWRPLGRVQLALAILMYLSAPMWLGFIALSMTRLFAGGIAPQSDLAFSDALWSAVQWNEGVALFATMMAVTFAPKIMGVVDIMLSAAKRRRYGGGVRMTAGALLELVFGMLVAPVVAVAQTIFIAGLFCGKRITWNAQMRDPREVRWGHALSTLWPQTLVGGAFAGVLAVFAPSMLPWAAPIVLAWLLAVPFAVISAAPGLGRALLRRRLCAVPEEFDIPPEVAAAQAPADREDIVGVLAAGGPVALMLSNRIPVPMRPES